MSEAPELATVAGFLAAAFREDAEGLSALLADVHPGALCFALAAWVNTQHGRADFGDLDSPAADAAYLAYLSEVQREIAAAG